jgi:hypothetical protein
MQLMCDAVTVLGSRHGLLFDPVGGRCQVIRFDSFPRMPSFALRAGAVINGKEYRFPLCPDGQRFAFFDQRLTPCTSRFIAIEPDSGLKLSLTFATPFRPRDAAYSTMPVIAIRLQAERISGNYRWTPVTVKPETVELFFEVLAGDLALSEAGADALDVRFTSRSTWSQHRDFGQPGSEWPQHDRIVCAAGSREGLRFVRRLSLQNQLSDTLNLAWCTHSGPVLKVHEQRCPFKYASRFADLDAVSAWARGQVGDILANAGRVDGLVANNNQSRSINDLLAYTLHSWLANTWWVDHGGRDWFSVWEGICHFHSTVDVEFTQSPFYLAVWPELLGIELDYWPEFSKDGSRLLGPRGEGMLFLSHDVGQMARADGQAYPHEMEVEETTNYLILLYAHWRRTGDFSIARAKRDFVEKYLAFLVACDSTGNGVPDRGIANTLDDASPAIQFGREQVYLAVKTLAAFRCGAAILREVGAASVASDYDRRAEIIRELVERKGWSRDHYVTLLDKRTEGVVNPWTGSTVTSDEVPGWDSCHIYTENAMAILDMVGLDLGLDPEHVMTDLRTATERCLQEYGCAHTDYNSGDRLEGAVEEGMVGVGGNPGWISMNMLRDMVAAYRGLDLRSLSERYWQWQVVTNTQEPCLFFETFGGNNLCFYPRGVAIWGLFDALAGRVIDRVAGVDRCAPKVADVRVPRLFDARWAL